MVLQLDLKNPRRYVENLRPDVDLSGYNDYTDGDFGRLVAVTIDGYSILRAISERERGGRKPERGHSDILTLFGKREIEDRITFPMTEGGYVPVSGPDDKPFLRRDREEVIRNLQDMGDPGVPGLDGALCFDLDGRLYDTQKMVILERDYNLNGSREEIIGIKGSIGTKHVAAAFASKKGLTAVALSHESGTVITFIGGKVIREFVYQPPKVEG